MPIPSLFSTTFFATAWLWAQQKAPPAGKGGILETLFGSQYSMFLMLGLIFIMFFLLVLQPERKRKAEFQSMLEQLKPNDRIITIGGIYGTVVQTYKDQDEIVIRVDEKTNAKLRIRRSAVAQVVSNDGKKDTSHKESA